MFETVFLMIFRYVSYTTDAKDLTEAFVALIERSNTEAVKVEKQIATERIASIRESTDRSIHELLVALCLKDPDVYAVAVSQKINAIKALRKGNGFSHTVISLVQAKNAIEDQRVVDAYNRYHNYDPEVADHNTEQQFPPDCEQ